MRVGKAEACPPFQASILIDGGHGAKSAPLPTLQTTLFLEHRPEQFLRPLLPLLRKDHRFHFPDGVVDHALFVQATEHTPIQTFPGAVVIVESQIEQRQRCLVDLVGIEGHCEPLAASWSMQSYSGSRRVQPGSAPLASRQIYSWHL